MNHVAAIVGGFNSQQKHAGQEGVRFTPIARATQAGAVNFLNANAFEVPSWAVNPDILRRIEPVGVLDRIRTGQLRVLGSLLSSARIARLVEQESIDGAAAYRPLDFLADVRKGIWSEAYGTAPVKIDAYRRNLQRAYVETLADRINGRTLPWTTRGRSSAASCGRWTRTCGRGGPHHRPRHAAAPGGRPDADRARARPGRPGDRPRPPREPAPT